MNTYRIKMGDVVKFPNGIEINYDESTGSLVILHPSKSKKLTLRPADDDDVRSRNPVVLSKGIWMLGVKS